MSSRTIRKLFGDSSLPPLEGNSDEEFEPLYAKDTNSKFSELVLSSHSESEQDVPETAEAEAVSTEKGKKKKKKKKKQRRPKAVTIAHNDDGTGKLELDEIDKSLMEVNAILGSPPPAAAAPVKKVDPVKQLLSVQAKLLDHNNELKRIFGSESLDDSRGKKFRPHNVVKYRRGVIVPIPENRQYHSVGLSMSLQRKDTRSYFTFDHNREYQKMHQQFLEVVRYGAVLPMQYSSKTHIEALLQKTDQMFYAEEYTAANNILEQIISYMHYLAHPCFNLTDQSVRLEYKYIENRPFHITVLKYCHMLTNKSCHRTALELAKLLLNLDPSDPLAVIFIIDTIALRAREHQWLIDAVDYWKKERDAGYLFNIKYSYAMAHFHVTRKSKSNDFSRADELLKEAMLHYPTVATRLLENCKQECPEITDHPYFTLAGEAKFPDNIRVAMVLHTKLVCWRWREQEVMQWFLRNGLELVDVLTNDPEVKMRSQELSRMRHSLYAACPEQIQRHLHVVLPMANLLAEWEWPVAFRQPSWDPLPPADGINRYGYGLSRENDLLHEGGPFNIFATFVLPGQLRVADRILHLRAPVEDGVDPQEYNAEPPVENPVSNPVEDYGETSSGLGGNPVDSPDRKPDEDPDENQDEVPDAVPEENPAGNPNDDSYQNLNGNLNDNEENEDKDDDDNENDENEDFNGDGDGDEDEDEDEEDEEDEDDEEEEDDEEDEGDEDDEDDDKDKAEDVIDNEEVDLPNNAPDTASSDSDDLSDAESSDSDNVPDVDRNGTDSTPDAKNHPDNAPKAGTSKPDYAPEAGTSNPDKAPDAGNKDPEADSDTESLSEREGSGQPAPRLRRRRNKKLPRSTASSDSDDLSDAESSDSDNVPDDDRSGTDSTPDAKNQDPDNAPDAGSSNADNAPDAGNSNADNAPDAGNSNAGNAPEAGTSNPDNAPEAGTSNPDNAPEAGTSNPDNAPEAGTSNPDNAPEVGTSNTDNAPEAGTSNPDDASEAGTSNPDKAPDVGNKDPEADSDTETLSEREGSGQPAPRLRRRRNKKLPRSTTVVLPPRTWYRNGYHFQHTSYNTNGSFDSSDDSDDEMPDIVALHQAFSRLILVSVRRPDANPTDSSSSNDD